MEFHNRFPHSDRCRPKCRLQRNMESSLGSRQQYAKRAALSERINIRRHYGFSSLPVLPPSLYAFPHRVNVDLQQDKISKLAWPIIAVIGGFLLLPIDVAILFTATMILGVFIGGNGAAQRVLPAEPSPEPSPRVENSWFNILLRSNQQVLKR